MNKERKQIIKGRVVSKTPKTVVVLVEREKIHPLYKKTFRRSKRYLVHDELGANLGDLVEIVKVRPVSRNKHFHVQKIIGKNIEAIIVEELKEKAAEAIAQVMPEEKESRVESQESSEENKKAVKEESKKKVKKVTKKEEKV